MNDQVLLTFEARCRASLPDTSHTLARIRGNEESWRRGLLVLSSSDNPTGLQISTERSGEQLVRASLVWEVTRIYVARELSRTRQNAGVVTMLFRYERDRVLQLERPALAMLRALGLTLERRITGTPRYDNVAGVLDANFQGLENWIERTNRTWDLQRYRALRGNIQAAIQPEDFLQTLERH